jgi:hypothetical protein
LDSTHHRTPCSFIDARGHYISALSVANQAKVYAPPVGPGSDVPGIISAIEAFCIENEVPAGELIQAYSYDDTVMPGGRLLNRDVLDDAFPDNPVGVGLEQRVSPMDAIKSQTLWAAAKYGEIEIVKSVRCG